MDKIIDWLALELPKYWKAAAAATVPVIFVGTEVVQAISDGSVDGSLSLPDVYRIVGSGIAAYAVFKAKNAPLKP